jgi:hypothetical protein
MPLPVQLLAMSHSSHRNIAGFIKTKGKTHFTLSDSENAQVVILDIDNQEGRDRLLELQSNKLHSNAVHVVALSLSPSDNIDSSIIQIKKPVTSIELIRVAEKIKSKSIKHKPSNSENRTSASITESKKSTTMRDGENNDEVISYDPKKTLQGMLRNAIQLSNETRSSALLHIQDYTIELNADGNLAYLNFPKNRLRHLCFMSLDTSICSIELGSLGERASEKASLAIAKPISLPIPELSWNVALLCARGRSPKNINDSLLYRLKRWPNLTRWTVPNNALNMASLWTRSSYSITSIAEQLSIPIIDARCFITAAIDSNLAVISEETPTHIPYKAKTESSTLFKKLLKHLKRD